MSRATFSHSFLHGFVYASKGWLLALQQRNMRIHVAIAVIVIGLGIFWGLSRAEWVGVAVAISMVLMAELFNTALEKLADEVTEQYREGIGHAKDIASGAVLVAAVLSVVIGLIVFWPHIFP